MAFLTKGRIVLAIVAALALGASHFGMYRWGHANGQGAELVACQAEKIDGLNSALQTLTQQAQRAGEKSRLLDQTLSAWLLANEQTTKELRDALDDTAADRTGCVFPVGVMRQLDAARARAAEAAASGIDGAMPTATGTD